MTKKNFLDPTQSDRNFYAEWCALDDHYEHCLAVESRARIKRQEAYKKAEISWLRWQLNITNRP